MSENREEEENLREELGFTVERGDELLRITNSIIEQHTLNNGYGRTSHVLLSIAGRKDLNDVEKVACAFLFACKTKSAIDKMENHLIRDKKGRPMDMPRIMDIDLKEFRGDISGMIVAPQGVELQELIAVVMATLMSLIRQMSKDEAQDFCRNASILFAKMAFIGDTKP